MHHTPIRASSVTKESPSIGGPSHSPTHKMRGYNSHRSIEEETRERGGYVPELIPEEDGMKYPYNRYRQYSMRATPPRYHITQTQ